MINRSQPRSISSLTLESSLLMDSSEVEPVLDLVQASPGHPLPEQSCPLHLYPACPKALTALDARGPCPCSPRVWVQHDMAPKAAACRIVRGAAQSWLSHPTMGAMASPRPPGPEVVRPRSKGPQVTLWEGGWSPPGLYPGPVPMQLS